MVKRVIVFIVLGLFLYPVSSFAETNEVTGTLTNEQVHFSAPDSRYVITGEVTIKNSSKEDIENVTLVMDLPEKIRLPIGFEDPIEIGKLKANDTITEEIRLELYPADLGNDHTFTVQIATYNQDDELEIITYLDGELDLSVMKNHYTEVDATVEGEVLEDKEGQHSLDIAIKGTNHSIYKFGKKDEIYLGFELPYNLELDADKAPEGMYYSIAGGSGGIVVVQIEADAEADFSTDYSIPLKGELSPKLVQDTKKRILMHTRRPGEVNEFKQNGTIEGQTDLDFSLLMAEDEVEENEINNDNLEETNDLSLEEEPSKQDQTERYRFFDIPFFVGILVGVLVTTLISFVVASKNKRK